MNFNVIKHATKSLSQLFFPATCPLCKITLQHNESTLCTNCIAQLPLTYQWEQKENSLTTLLAARIPITTAAALLHYKKGTQTQKAVHLFKYKGNQDIALTLGKIFGQQLKESPLYKDIDLIIPVPLHPLRKFIRGYNQAEIFAKGIAESLNIPLETKAISRSKRTQKQALKKTKSQRWQNVHNAFYLKNPQKILGQKILLVDDVITTGATIESCANAITTTIPELNIKIGACAMVK